MVKIEVEKDFKYEGKRYEKGKTYDVPERTAHKAVGMGYAIEQFIDEDESPEISDTKELEGEPKIEEPEPEDKWSKLKSRAKTAAGDTPPHWDPEEEDWLVGTVIGTGTGANNRFVEVKVAEGPVGGRRKAGLDEDEEPVYEDCEVDEGNSVLLWESTVLEDFFDQVKAGKDIAVQFTGTKQTRKGGSPTKLYDWGIGD